MFRNYACIFILAVNAGCSGAGGSSRSSAFEVQTGSPNIVWSDSQNGLSLGIEKPSSPLVFEPVKNWKGPLIIEQKDASGGITVRDNPGGRWNSRAVVNVIVKNTSERTI